MPASEMKCGTVIIKGEVSDLLTSYEEEEKKSLRTLLSASSKGMLTSVERVYCL
jgi:formylmethanofuran dehydrogenase subunit C